MISIATHSFGPKLLEFERKEFFAQELPEEFATFLDSMINLAAAYKIQDDQTTRSQSERYRLEVQSFLSDEDSHQYLKALAILREACSYADLYPLIDEHQRIYTGTERTSLHVLQPFLAPELNKLMESNPSLIFENPRARFNSYLNSLGLEIVEIHPNEMEIGLGKSLVEYHIKVTDLDRFTLFVNQNTSQFNTEKDALVFKKILGHKESRPGHGLVNELLGELAGIDKTSDSKNFAQRAQTTCEIINKLKSAGVLKTEDIVTPYQELEVFKEPSRMSRVPRYKEFKAILFSFMGFATKLTLAKHNKEAMQSYLDETQDDIARLKSILNEFKDDTDLYLLSRKQTLELLVKVMNHINKSSSDLDPDDVDVAGKLDKAYTMIDNLHNEIEGDTE